MKAGVVGAGEQEFSFTTRPHSVAPSLYSVKWKPLGGGGRKTVAGLRDSTFRTRPMGALLPCL